MSHLSKRRLSALGRGKTDRVRMVQVHGKTFEVVQLRGGTYKVFRLDLDVTLIEPDDPQLNLVESQIRWEDFEERRRRGEVKPGEPRPVKPHIPGMKVGGGHG